MEIASDKVGEAIILAREIVQEMPGAEAQFDGLVEALNVDERADLVALLWVGRGDYDLDEWDEATAAAVDEATVPASVYLKGQPQLADHLEAGLEAMGVSARDAEDDATAP